MAAGDLRERIIFEMRVDASDGMGNKKGAWVAQFTVAAKRMALRGSEPVLAARLSGVQPFVLRIRQSKQARLIATDWRARDARGSGIYNIHTIAPDERGEWFDLMVDEGAVAD